MRGCMGSDIFWRQSTADAWHENLPAVMEEHLWLLPEEERGCR